MPRLLASQVFVPTSFPEHTYVQRNDQHQERLLAEWLRSSTTIASVAGPSKAGKTVLVQRIVGEKNLITVSGGSVRSADQLWERVLDWGAEPHSTTASAGETQSDLDTKDHQVQLGISGTGAQHKRSHAAQSGTQDTLTAVANRRGLPQVVERMANKAETILLDDFHYIPVAVQTDVAQQLKDASSRGVRICVANVPHRADNVVRALPELRGRVLAVDLDYWSRRDLLEIPALGCPLLGINIDSHSLAMFALESAGSPQLMQSICQWMCNQLKVLETLEPSQAFTLDDATRKEILYLTSLSTDHRSLVRSLLIGSKRTGERKTYVHRDGRKGDIYLTILRAVAADPPRLAIGYGDLQERLKLIVKDDSPEGAQIVNAAIKLSQIAASSAPPTGPSLEWDEQDQVFVLADPYLLFYLRWSGILEKEAEADA